METCIGIRREDMYAWERRTPLVPEDVRELAATTGMRFVVQSSPRRAFDDAAYRSAGIPVSDSLPDCRVIIGLKEIPLDALEADKVYVFFSHTIKGQPFNMPMLQRVIDLGSTLIDYERIVDEEDRRLVFFGNYAGLAGMIDTLWTLGRRLAWEGWSTPLGMIRQASTYDSLAAAKAAVREAGDRLRVEGLPSSISPLRIGIAGYGNVSRGAQEILDLLPVREVDPSALISGASAVSEVDLPIHKVVFKEEDTVLRIDSSRPFDLKEYYDHPDRYKAAFRRYLPHLNVLVNCIYWEPKYPRLITHDDIASLYASEQPALRVIGDITCDVRGSIEITVKATEPDDPVYVYRPAHKDTVPGVEGDGPVLMAVEILPSELPREASTYFSGVLKKYIPAIVREPYEEPFETCTLPQALRRAVIVYRGALTPQYNYLQAHLPSAETAAPGGETP